VAFVRWFYRDFYAVTSHVPTTSSILQRHGLLSAWFSILEPGTAPFQVHRGL
jgi:aspartyl/asparaginyl beta-hydroxylase (cupin superfamily)